MKGSGIRESLLGVPPQVTSELDFWYHSGQRKGEFDMKGTTMFNIDGCLALKLASTEYKGFVRFRVKGFYSPKDGKLNAEALG